MPSILTDLKGENSYAFGQLYKEYYPMVKYFVLRNNGSEYDSEDIFQETMMVLVEKLRQDDFVLTASLKTYVMAIAKNLWFKKLRTVYSETEYTEEYNDKFFEEINAAIENEKTYKDKLQGYIHQISNHCQGLIHDIFFKEKNIEQIQKEYGYSSRHNAQNQKHKCVEQIRKVKQEAEKKY